jgi:hypothetical protein
MSAAAGGYHPPAACLERRMGLPPARCGVWRSRSGGGDRVVLVSKRLFLA